MIERIIEYSIRNKFFVILLTGVIIAGGIYSMLNIPLDAIPDLSDVQVIVYTEYPGQAPQVVEDQITYPLTTTMLAVPLREDGAGILVLRVFLCLRDIRGRHRPVLGPEPGARVLVCDSIAAAAGTPAQLGPDATGVGWVYEYALVDKTGKHDLSELRSIQDWFLGTSSRPCRASPRWPASAVSSSSTRWRWTRNRLARVRSYRSAR